MQVNLSWQAVPNVLWYNIYRGTFTTGPYDLIGKTNPNTQQTPLPSPVAPTTYQDGPNNLINGQDYFYVVSAVTVDGESSYSNEFVSSAPVQPASPLSLTGVVT